MLCGGMGAGAAQALKREGIDPVIITTALSADDAVTGYLRGTLAPSTGELCDCHH